MDLKEKKSNEIIFAVRSRRLSLFNSTPEKTGEKIKVMHLYSAECIYTRGLL